MKSKLSVVCVQEHTFLDSRLGPDAMVIDCGGFHGGFCQEVTTRYGCLCHVLEPSPQNFSRIPESPHIIRHPMALSTADGVAEFNLADSPICNSLHSVPETQLVERIQVTTTSIDSFIARHRIAHVALLKLDIEGVEMEVLETIRPETLALIDQITVEFHGEYIHPQGTARRRMDAIVNRLQAAGFQLLRPMRPIYFDTLFVKASTFSLNWSDRCRLRLKHEHWSRVTRAAQRLVRPSPIRPLAA